MANTKSGKSKGSNAEFDEEWMDDKGNEVTPEERAVADDSNETSGGRRPGKIKGETGGDSPRS